MTRKKLTPDEEDQIVELKLQRVPVRTIAQQVGCAPLTVQRCWNRYLAQRVKERMSETATQVEAAFVQGRPVDLDDRHKRLWKKYEEKYRRLGRN